MKTNEIKRTAEWLDERFYIAQDSKRQADKVYYEGALKAIEFIGFTWDRDINGKHKIYKN